MDAFGTVLIAVAVAAIVVSCLSYLGSGGVYRGLGRTGLSLDEPDQHPEPPPGSPAARAEAQEEIHQLLEAKSARREARGEAPLDIPAEMAALAGGASKGDSSREEDSPIADRASTAPMASLREEVRQLVVARNERRMRRGEAPLDVEPEVDRQLEEFGA